METKLTSYKPHKPGMKALLRSGIAEIAVRGHGRRVQSRASTMYGASNYGLKVQRGATRVRAIVHTGDRYAMRSNRLHNTLQKSIKG